MYYSTIKLNDIANGPGARTTLFVSGCRNKCPDCFNPETWNFRYGKEFTKETADYILDQLESQYNDGLTILGGEPLEPENQGDVFELVNRVKTAFPEKKIWMYTGFTWNDILHNPSCRACTNITAEILNKIDILVDGPFDNTKTDYLLRFRGSSNQRLIDVQESLKSNQVVIWHDDPIFDRHDW